ncbi:GNAT family N-acetyltransferase [Microbacterium lushaniae]|uniref:GNAT family N-acetyltransferase n=1 Tax=Microbacterium lushaniae TaxID=2614639 RepID=A0A5J6L8H8_9MICO|nr:GNAT family N-acetyltransferase [Microbacterium lushaniae]
MGTRIRHPSVSLAKGYGREVARLIAHFAFDRLGLSAVFATVDTENVGSLRLLTGIGFVQTNHPRDGERVAILMKPAAAVPSAAQ